MPKLGTRHVWKEMREDLLRMMYHTVFECSFGYDFRPPSEEMDEFTQSSVVYGRLMPIVFPLRSMPLPLQMPMLRAALALVTEDTVTTEDMRKPIDMIDAWLTAYAKHVRGSASVEAAQFYADKVLDAVDEGHVTRDEAVADVAMAFRASTHNIVALLEQSIMHAARNPELQERVSAELRAAYADVFDIKLAELRKLSLLRCFNAEVARLNARAPTLVPRNAPTAMEYKGVVIPKGSAMIGNVSAIHTDPLLWGEDAADFRPDRWLDETGAFDSDLMKKVVNFGIGRRNCPGRALGENHQFLIVAQLLHKYKFESASGKAADVPLLNYYELNSPGNSKLEIIVSARY